MMGHKSGFQPKLFYHGFNLEQKVPQNHILRRIEKKIDFDFIYAQVRDSYGDNGNVSVPPPVILKMILLLIFYNVRSERELMNTIPLRLDWLWFLGYDLDDEIPNHSVLSKARARWGVSAFKTFFEHTVWQCVTAGLVDGKKLFVDSSLIDADASNNSVVDTENLKRHLNKGYRRLEQRLDDLQDHNSTPANSRHISTTDPDASVIRHGRGRSKLRYKIHRGVDPKHEVITATQTTTGSVDDGHLLQEMFHIHRNNTQKNVDTAVADSRYGNKENFLICHDLGINAHIPCLEKTQRGSGRQKDIFPKEAFSYDRETDTFACPAGQILTKRNYYKKRRHYEYKAPSGICTKCQLQEKCTRSKDGRTLKRHARQDDLDLMLKRASSQQAKKDIKTRQHLIERSFARATRYGFKRARWRRLWRVQIQEYLTSTIQNLMILLRHVKEPAPALGQIREKSARPRGYSSLQRLHFCFKSAITRIIEFHFTLEYFEARI